VQTTFILPARPAPRSASTFRPMRARLPALWSKPFEDQLSGLQTIHTMDTGTRNVIGVMCEFHCIPADVKEARVAIVGDLSSQERMTRPTAHTAWSIGSKANFADQPGCGAPRRPQAHSLISHCYLQARPSPAI